MIFLLSGPLAVGKTSVANELIDRHAFQKISSSDYLKERLALANSPVTRTNLQALGDNLDIETNFGWLADEVVKPAVSQSPATDWLIDAVRKSQQVERLKTDFDECLHIHLTAAEHILCERYNQRLSKQSNQDRVSYEVAIGHPNEVSARSLVNIADLVLDVGILTPSQAVQRILAE